MKKIFLLLTGILFSAVFSSCITTKNLGTTMTVIPVNEYDGISLALIEISKFGDSWYQSAHKNDGFINGFKIKITNNTEKIIKMVDCIMNLN